MADKSDEDLKSCSVLSVVLSRIIEHTANDEFRDQCFKVLKTDNRLGAQTALAANLSSSLSHVNQVTQERRKTTKKKSMKKSTDDKTQ